jgi:hypothetical protein
VWRDTQIPGLLLDKLTHGGIVVFASAAALTLGAFTIPVYEIYKVGEEPRWVPGLDVLGRIGLPVALIPHYDNAEGGTHDTRYCYLGERRLRSLEADLPSSHFVLGVDSHTALVLDLVAGRASVLGLGGVTVRVAGRSETFPTGRDVPLDELSETARRLRDGVPSGDRQGVSPAPEPGDAADDVPVFASARSGGTAFGGTMDLPGTHSPLLDEVRTHERQFETAARDGDAGEAARQVLDVERLLVSWSRDTGAGEDVDRARAVLQALILRLGEVGRTGGPSRDDLGTLVDILVERRAAARTARDFGLGDRIRDGLTSAGIELHDSPAGTTWEWRA